jgi:hypothetical protein
MLNTYIYHQLPPTCFGVCYTIFRESIVLLAQKLCFSVAGDVSKKEGPFDVVDDETSPIEGHISYSFPSLSCLNFTCQFLFQTARLSMVTSEFSCYCCTFRVSIKL